MKRKEKRRKREKGPFTEGVDTEFNGSHIGQVWNGDSRFERAV